MTLRVYYGNVLNKNYPANLMMYDNGSQFSSNFFTLIIPTAILLSTNSISGHIDFDGD